jgi:hypothetical protein
MVFQVLINYPNFDAGFEYSREVQNSINVIPIRSYSCDIKHKNKFQIIKQKNHA